MTARSAPRPLNDLEFPRSQAGLKIGPDLGMGNLAHSATKPIADQSTFVDNRLTLEVLVAGKGDRFSNALKGVDGLLLVLTPFMCGPNNSLGLVPKVCRQLPMRGHHLSW